MTTVVRMTGGSKNVVVPGVIGGQARRILSWTRRRRWPLAAALASVVTGMAFSLAWGPVVHGGTWTHMWLTPGDLWGVYRSAHYVGWGGYSDIYGAGTGFLSFPGILFLYAPLAALTGALGMTENFPYPLAHPTTWLVLGPYSLLIGAVVLFALDSVAERLGVPKGRRAVLCFAEAAVLWNVDVIMGHPEDALALAFALYALMALWSNQTRRSGWLFGLAVLFQPLVLLMFPVFLFHTAWGQRAKTLCRSVVPSFVALALPLVADWHYTSRSLVDQPFPLRTAHITPFTSWAPKVAIASVAGGPGRMIALLLCVGIGWVSTRHRLGLADILWIAAVCLSLRTVLDSALASYYPWPPLALALVVAAGRSRSRLAVTWLCAIGVTVTASLHFGPWWAWWSGVVGGLVVTLGVARPAHAVVPDEASIAPAPIGDPGAGQADFGGRLSDRGEKRVVTV
jgi:hypothetical protein